MTTNDGTHAWTGLTLMRVASVLSWLAVASVLLPISVAGETGDDWHVVQDTHLKGQTMRIDGDVTIAPNVTLTLENSDLYVGGLLHVQQGATLELLPSSSGSPSRLLPQSEGEGFWIHVEGRMVSQGGEIRGLSGNGLVSTLPGNTGGMRVSGYAELEGIYVHDGTAGITIDKGGDVVLRDATIEHLGESAITVLGSLHIERTTVAHNEANLVAKDTCNILIEDSYLLDAEFEHMLINNCKAEVHRSTLDGAGVAIVGNNGAEIRVHNTTLKAYTIDGIGSYAGPDPTLRPTLRFHDVSFEPAPSAERAADLEGSALAEFVNVEMNGHASHGIQAKQATLSVRDSMIASNGGNGIHLTGGMFVEDPLTAGNQFVVDGRANAAGAVSHLRSIGFAVVKETKDGLVLLEGEMAATVFSAEGEPMALISDQSTGPGQRQIMFQTYITGSEGDSFLGPFTYEVEHPHLHGSASGSLERGQDLVIITAQSTFLETMRTFGEQWSAGILVVIGAALVWGARAKKRSVAVDDDGGPRDAEPHGGASNEDDSGH